MRSREGGKDQFPGVRLTRVDFHAGHPFIRIDEVGHVRKIEARIDAESIHVHADGHDIGVARPFAVAK